MTVNLELNNGHFALMADNLKSRSVLHRIPGKAQKLVVCDLMSDIVTCFDGENKWALPYHECNELTYKHYFGEFAYVENTFIKDNLVFQKQNNGSLK